MPLVLDGDTGIVGVLLTDANGNVTFDTNTLYVDAPNNRVGIGTTSPNSNLHIKSTGDVKLTLETDEDNDCWINLSGATSEASIGYEPASNSLRFANAADGVTSNVRMTIDASGNVGIGTTSPDALLHVQHTSVNQAFIVANRYNDASTGSDFRAIFAVAEADPHSAGTTATIIGNHNRHIHIGPYFGPDGTTNATGANLTLLSTGNVGIGIDTPSAKLHIQEGSSGGSLTEAFRISDSSYTNIAMYSGGADGEIKIGAAGQLRGSYKAQYAGTGGSYNFNIGTNATNAITIDTSQKVGIGTNTPGEKLHVYGSGEQFIKLETTTTGSAAFVGLRMQDGDGDLGSIGDFGSGRRAFMLDTGSGVDMMFFTNNQNNSANTPRMTISSSGKIGINTLPLADTTGTLHVGGGLSVGSGNHAGYHVFSQHEGNVPSNTTRDVLQFEGPAYARYMTVTISGYLCRKEQYFSGYQSWDGASNGNNVGSTVNGTTTFSNGTNSSDSRAKIQLECSAVSGTSGHPRYKLKLITGGVTGQLYDTTVVVKFYNPPFYPTYL